MGHQVISELSRDVTAPGTRISCPQSVPSTGQGVNHHHVLLTGLHAWCLQLGREPSGGRDPTTPVPHSLLHPGTVSGLSEHSGLSDQRCKKPEWQPLTSWAAHVLTHDPTFCSACPERRWPERPKALRGPPGALQYRLALLSAGRWCLLSSPPWGQLGARPEERRKGSAAG